jgi:hypothetical protein
MPRFQPRDRVQYRWSAIGPFADEAYVVEVLPGDRYRLEPLNGARFPRGGGIFAEGQLWLTLETVGSGLGSN